VAKEGLFAEIFGNGDDKNSDAVARAKAKQKAAAEKRAAAAKKGLAGKKGLAPKKGLAVSKTLEVDGRWGPATTAAVQAALGQPRTGEDWINNADATVLQKKLGVTADGFFTKDHYKELQRYLGVAPDGIFGVESVKALQARLNAGTF
jgi:lysozyme family protein